MSEATKAVYTSLSAKARGERVHKGPQPKSRTLPARDCHSWIDKRYKPYSPWEISEPAEKHQSSREPPTLFLPPEGAKAKKVRARAQALIEKRDPWDQEHHISHSRMNHEVQVFTREYFDKPVRKENEGVPKVRELYAVNDRQCGWNDDPGPSGEMRRTYLDHIGPWNVGGPKAQQLPSYWRNIRNWRSLSDTGLHLSKPTKKSDEEPDMDRPDAVITALADTPAAFSTQAWHGFQRHQARAAKESGSWDALASSTLSRGNSTLTDPLARTSSSALARTASSPLARSATMPLESAPTSPAAQGSSSPLRARTETCPASFAASGFGESRGEGSREGKRPAWNDRWGVTLSKDNPRLSQAQRQYFNSAQFLSGAELGHPATYLGGKHQQ